MQETPYDRASRLLAREAGKPLVCWLTRTPDHAISSLSLLDTRLSVPGWPEREGDLIWRLERTDRGGEPWALLHEFQAIPDGLMFGRLGVYGSLFWLQEKAGPHSGDRYRLAFIVVNLTGRGNSARCFDWAAGQGISIQPFEWNLQDLQAEEILTQVEGGEAPLELLAWMPLMKRGGEADIIQQWLSLANAEPKPARKGLLRTVLVFAELAKCQPQWEKAMEGFNVMRSTVIERWQAEGRAEGEAKGRAEGFAEAIRDILTEKFAPLPTELLAALSAIRDEALLRRWVVWASSAGSLDEFRQKAGI